MIDTLSFLQPLEMVAAMANLHDMLNPSAPVFIRMAEGQNCAQMMEGSSVWMFRANKSYIWQLLNCTGFAENPEMENVSVVVRGAGTSNEKRENFLYVFAERDQIGDFRKPQRPWSFNLS